MRIHQLYCSALLIIPILVGCSDPGSNSPNLDPGVAVLVIGDTIYEGLAVVDTFSYGDESIYERMTLNFSDTLVVTVENKIFDEELVFWSRAFESTSPSGYLMRLSERVVGGSLFMAEKGFLHISERTESTVRGKFDMTFTNLYAPYHECPAGCLAATAYFVAEINY